VIGGAASVGDVRDVGATDGERRPKFSGAKFAPPTVSPAAISRPRVVARLRAGLECGIGLVVGSAGSGKTSALLECVAGTPPDELCWINVDDADATPARFWHGMIRAVGATHDGFGAEALAMIAADEEVGADAIESLIDELSRLDPPLTLVLDDLHVVRRGLEHSMRRFVARRPESVRLLIGSRSEPPIDLARLRAADLVVEVRDADLAFDRDEAGEVLKRLGVSAGDPLTDRIWERTEGWAAGIHLAGVALRTSADPAGFLDRLVSSDDVIAHYLSTQVLEAQPPEVVEFMLNTSIVDELTPSLAAVLTDGSPIALADIEASHLMLIRNSAHPDVFRYHHLLLALLRLRLAATDPRRERRCHEIAAKWYEDVGDLAAAFRHHWRADHRDAAMQLLGRNLYEAYLADALPELSSADIVLTDSDIVRAPGPALSVATTLCLRNHRHDAARLADRIESLVGSELDGAELGQLACLRTFVAAGGCDMEGAVQHASEARRIAAQTGLSGDGYAAADTMLVRACAWAGDWAAAEAVVESRPVDDRPSVATIEWSGALANLDIFRGRLTAGIDHARRNIELASAGERARPSMASPGVVLLACGLLERGDICAAEELLVRIDVADRHTRLPARVVGAVALSRLHRSSGDIDVAVTLLESCRGRLRHLRDDSWVVAHVNECRAHHSFTVGDDERSGELADALPAGTARDLAHARLMVRAGDLADADRLLERAANHAAGTRAELAVALVRLSAAIRRGDAIGHAADAVISIAAPERFVFMIAEEGSDVLDAVQRRVRRVVRTEFVDTILRTRPHATAVHQRSVVEPLSEREREVLRYLATSMAYREIADELFVSVNTLKSHVKNAFRKLGATTREEALEIGRAAGFV
jgi:LuxR family maltose regulon positive regulatory protein